MLAVFLMPPALSVLSPLDGAATLPEDMDSTPDIVLVTVPVILLRWQPQVLPASEPPLVATPRQHTSKVDLLTLDCILLC